MCKRHHFPFSAYTHRVEKHNFGSNVTRPVRKILSLTLRIVITVEDPALAARKAGRNLHIRRIVVVTSVVPAINASSCSPAKGVGVIYTASIREIAKTQFRGFSGDGEARFISACIRTCKHRCLVPSIGVATPRISRASTGEHVRNFTVQKCI